MSRIAAVVLAAGLSSRMPGNKLLTRFMGKPLVCHAVDAAVASSAAPVIVVTGNAGDSVAVTFAETDVVITENHAFTEGLSTSLRCGVNSVPEDCDGAIVLLGDMPFVTAETINRLIDSFDPDTGREICVPVHNRTRGNPVLWGRRFFPEMMALTGDKGAKSLMALHTDVLYELEVGDDGVLIDIDTPQDLQKHQS